MAPRSTSLGAPAGTGVIDSSVGGYRSCMNCPVCAVALTPTMHEGVQVMSCPTCNGCFVNFMRLRATLAGEAQPRTRDEQVHALRNSGTASVVDKDERDALSCPVCRATMRRYIHQHSSGVWIDTCSSHGAWLDAGELEQLEAWTEATRQAEGRPAATPASEQPALPADEPTTGMWRAADGDEDSDEGLGSLLGRATARLRGLGRK